jgi:pilus assembly protein CpaE
MARILAIDDDEDMCALVALALRSYGYEVETATSGLEGLKVMHQFSPDALIIDKMMPGMDGYEVVRRVRRDPEFGDIPILVLTAEENLEGKVDAFEIGADDYLNKPFAREELNARLASLLRRSQRSGGYRAADGGRESHIIAVHTLRGGIGTTTIAVNLAVALRELWRAPTLLVDMVLLSGHVSLFLDTPAKRNWADLAREDLDEIDEDLINHVISSYETGLDFLAAPGTPSSAELITPEIVNRALEVMQPRYEYVVFDLPHTFDDITLSILDRADIILLVVAPELAAVRAASMALDTYSKLNYDQGVVQLILNRPFDEDGLSPMDVSRVLRHPTGLSLPFGGRRPVQAINQGTPLVEAWPEHPASERLASFAYEVSKQVHRDIPPISPSEMWQRVKRQREENVVRRTVGKLFRQG